MRARVGPYLFCDTALDVTAKVAARMAVLDNDQTDPVSYLPLADVTGTPWRDQLEDSRDKSTAAFEPDCCHTYLVDRVIHQEEWFGRKSHLFAAFDRRYEAGAKIVPTAALAGGAEPGTWRLVIEVAAIALPPVGSGITALQSLMEGRRLSRS